MNPPLTIDDPTDKKPSDWVEAEMMDDPEAKKPEDWDQVMSPMLHYNLHYTTLHKTPIHLDRHTLSINIHDGSTCAVL